MIPSSQPSTYPCRTHRKKRVGFSLLEALVGLGLFAIAVMVMTQSVTNGLLGIEAMNRRGSMNYDESVIQKQFLEIKEKPKFLEGGSVATPFQGEVSWSAELEDTAVANLMKATVTLKWPEEKETIHIYYLFRKKWMEESILSDIHQKLKSKIESPEEE